MREELSLPPPWGSAASPGLSSDSLSQLVESQSAVQQRRPRPGPGWETLCQGTLCRGTGGWEEERGVSSQEPDNQVTTEKPKVLVPKTVIVQTHPPRVSNEGLKSQQEQSAEPKLVMGSSLV